MSSFEQPADHWQQHVAAAARDYPQQYDQRQYSQQMQSQLQSYPPPPQVPIFQVTTMTHIGLLVFWFNQRRMITGTFDQCDAALRSANSQNFILGWWSFLSLLLNWIAISHNSSARKKLYADAANAQAYAQWWYQSIAPARQNGS